MRAGLCVPVPESVPDEVAALAEPLGCVLHAFDRSALRAGEDVAIVGAGLRSSLELVDGTAPSRRAGFATLAPMLNEPLNPFPAPCRFGLRRELER